MIISDNRQPSLQDFSRLMERTDSVLNDDAKRRSKYYLTRNGTKLETDVYNALLTTTQGTPFEGTVHLVSGASFPDITIHGYYGVEVKSTQSRHWKSVGSSILESTRDANIKKIYLTFGKLSNPVGFISRPYEDCLYDIAVTHYPRYLIDMETQNGGTIFDKMQVSYESLRKMEKPVEPVASYYKSQLAPGESLWWAPGEDLDESSRSPILKLWTALTPSEKQTYTIKGYALFPEILKTQSTTKYQRYALWLVTTCSVVNPNIRDQFSAGGKVDVQTPHGMYERMPAAFGRIAKYSSLIRQTIDGANVETLKDYWEKPRVEENRLKQWADIVAKAARTDEHPYSEIFEMLSEIFSF